LTTHRSISYSSSRRKRAFEILIPTKTKGLLFAGSETQVWVSFDDGDRWQSVRQNMPASSIRDLVLKDDDVVVATRGRGFWILDDIEPLRQASSKTHSSSPTVRAYAVLDRLRGVREQITAIQNPPPAVPAVLAEFDKTAAALERGAGWRLRRPCRRGRAAGGVAQQRRLLAAPGDVAAARGRMSRRSRRAPPRRPIAPRPSPPRPSPKLCPGGTRCAVKR
jgi:hypothetical protein